jgi:hypothetical protein
MVAGVAVVHRQLARVLGHLGRQFGIGVQPHSVGVAADDHAPEVGEDAEGRADGDVDLHRLAVHVDAEIGDLGASAHRRRGTARQRLAILGKSSRALRAARARSQQSSACGAQPGLWAHVTAVRRRVGRLEGLGGQAMQHGLANIALKLAQPPVGAGIVVDHERLAVLWRDARHLDHKVEDQLACKALMRRQVAVLKIERRQHAFIEVIRFQ